MPFIRDIYNTKSIAIVGLEKNTGKTECLNYILKRIKKDANKFAITSIGIDGEKNDQVTQSHKPEIEIPEEMFFTTSEQHYRKRKLTAEIVNISREHTSIGRLITAKTVCEGKVLLSGPPDTKGVKELIGNMTSYGVSTTIVDGALSRLSPASPMITDALILATGASVSANIPELVRKTLYTYKLISMPKINNTLSDKLSCLHNGLWAIDKEDNVYDLKVLSVFMLDKVGNDIFRYGRRIYVTGVVSDRLINYLRVQKEPTELIVKDFTRVFVSPHIYDSYINNGGIIKTILSSKLLAIIVNPVSPNGFTLDSQKLCDAMKESLGIPVYDLMKI